MPAPYERLKEAWDTGAPHALDRVAEQLAREGVAESAILDELMRLLLEVRAAGADDETEERIHGVMDRLTGWCHESNHIRTRRFTLPAAEEIATLPRWARVAFAARCARRVLPLFKYSWPDAPEEYVAAVARDVEAAEQYARTAARAIDFNDAVEATVAARLAKSSAAIYAALAAAKAIQSAKFGRGSDDHAREAAEATTAAAEAVDTARIAAGVRPIIRHDFDHLARLAQRQHWTDDTPVPPEVFGPLWPEGPPTGWPADPDTPQQTQQPVAV